MCFDIYKSTKCFKCFNIVFRLALKTIYGICYYKNVLIFGIEYSIFDCLTTF